MLDESMKTYERDKGLREKLAVAEFGNVLRRADKENLGLVEEATETYEESFEPLEEKVKKMMTQSSRNTAKLEAADEDVALLNELQREGATLLEETLRDQRSYSKKVRASEQKTTRIWKLKKNDANVFLIGRRGIVKGKNIPKNSLEKGLGCEMSDKHKLAWSGGQ